MFSYIFRQCFHLSISSWSTQTHLSLWQCCRIRLHYCPPGGQYWLRSWRLLYCVPPSTGYQEALYRTGLWRSIHGLLPNTVVPATAGHRWFRGKVALRGRWPLVTGNGHMRHYVKSNTHIRQHKFYSTCTTLWSTAVNYNAVQAYSERWNEQCWKCVIKSTAFIHSVLRTGEHTHTCAVLYFKICRSNRRRFEMSHGNWPL